MNQQTVKRDSLTREERSDLNRLAWELSRQAYLAYIDHLVVIGIKQKRSTGCIDMAVIAASVPKMSDLLRTGEVDGSDDQH